MKGAAMRFYPESFNISTPTDRSIQVERHFNAPRTLVFEAFTRPELVRRWLLGPDGWTMPVCEIDLRPGGRYRYLWRRESTGTEMGMGGVFLEVVPPEKIVATEAFDDSWYPGEAIDTTLFEQDGDITKVRLTVLYESKEARDIASRSGMDTGMVAGYNRLEEVLTSLPRRIGLPVVAKTTPQLVAAIHITIPRSQIRSVMGPGLNEVMSAVSAQAIGPAGSWFTHHLKITPETFDFEICVPVNAPVAPAGRVVAREVPAMRIASTVYRGPYEELGDAWGEFDRWLVAGGHVPAPDLYEFYTVGPESRRAPSEWQTELRRPLLDA
jgi:uncharacterized protein YndB with AHSA1/START domain/effector-binding domain-containing protein